MSYRGYTEVQKSRSPPKNVDKSDAAVGGGKDFIELKSKTIPFDLIVPWVRHLIGQQHSTSKCFSAY